MANEAEIQRTTTLGEMLRRYRQVAGMSQEALAERAQLSWRAISDLERGITRVPRKETLRLLVEALALTAEARAELEKAGRTQLPARLGDASRHDAQPGRVPAEQPLVGRDDEVALLVRHLAGHGPPVLLLAGEPGIGKSRVLRESVRRAAGAGWCVLSGGCQRLGNHAPYAPILGALTGHIQGQTAVRQRIDLQGCAWLVRLLPELATGPLAPSPAGTLPPEQERRLMCAAVARYLRNVAGPSGTILVLDDLQWAGADALDLLTTVIHTAVDVPLRVIGAYRDTEVRQEDALFVVLADLATAGLVQQHTMRPLAPIAAGQLLDLHLGMRKDAEMRAQLLARAGGVPFFLVSCAQEFSGSDATASPRDVPWTITQSVQQRVSVLTEGARDLLAIAAVAGRQASYALLVTVSRRPEREVLAMLQGACRAGLMDDVKGIGIRFAHDVIREVIEFDVGAGQRMLLHRDIAQALEHMRGEPPVEDLAYHYARSMEHASAAFWLERAGDTAAAGFAHASALAQYVEARERLTTCGAALEALARIDEKLGDLHTLLGDYAQACADYARARTEAAAPAHQVDLARKEGDTWVKRGDLVHGQELFTTATTLAGDSPDGDISSIAYALLEVSQGEVLSLQGDYPAALARAGRVQTLLQSDEPSRAVEACLIRAYQVCSCAFNSQGDLAQAFEWDQRADAHRAYIVDPIGQAYAFNSRGQVAFRRGAATEAEECIAHSQALWKSIGDLEEIGNSWLCLGNLALSWGDLVRAEACFTQCLMLRERTGHQVGIAALTGLLGVVARDRGDLVRAEGDLQRSVALWTRLGVQQPVAWIDNDLGVVLCRRGDLTAAEACHQRSRIMQERLGDQRGLLRSWVYLAEVACARGDGRSVSIYCRRARLLARRQGNHFMNAIALLLQVHAWLEGSHARSRLRASTVVLGWVHALVTTHTFTAEGIQFASIRMPAMQLTLLTAQLRLQQGALAEARAAGLEVEQWAQGEGRQYDGALAQRVLGQCALAQGDLVAAESHLRVALERQIACGAALEAARTRLALAQVLVATRGPSGIPVEARMLLTEAEVQYTTCGVTWDLALVEQLTT